MDRSINGISTAELTVLLQSIMSRHSPDTIDQMKECCHVRCERCCGIDCRNKLQGLGWTSKTRFRTRSANLFCLSTPCGCPRHLIVRVRRRVKVTSYKTSLLSVSYSNNGEGSSRPMRRKSASRLEARPICFKNHDDSICPLRDSRKTNR
jgi:hypothetical protein